MSYTDGTKTYADYPKGKPWEGREIEENPTKYQTGVVSGGPGGGNEWESHPNPESKFTTDTLHPKKSQ